MHLLETTEQQEQVLWPALADLATDLSKDIACNIPFYYKPKESCLRVYQYDGQYCSDTKYFIGVDWIVKNEAAIYVAPKMNNQQAQIDFLGMLLHSLETTETLEHLDGLFHIDYDAPWIELKQQPDILSPILIVQFLKLVQRIVQKGLKKSYYRVTENLNSRIKGKILIGQQIKRNVVKNRLTNTVCNYQQYGINTPENQFLKLVLSFVVAYLNRREHYFNPAQVQQLQHILAFCQPAFQHVDILATGHQPIHVRKNVFYREYEEAVKVGNYILKRFSFNISKASETHITSPPFWIDMSKLFELYVFGKLNQSFQDQEAVTYHDTFRGGKETDILIRKDGYKCVIDCKYKPRYKGQSPDLMDMRQVAGYTRLKSVYNKLGVTTSQGVTPVVKGLIIYPDQNAPEQIDKDKLFDEPINDYVEFFKLGVKLPELNPNNNEH